MKKYSAYLVFLFFCVHADYLWHAWNYSYMDSFDWIFYLLSVPVVLWVSWQNKSGRMDHGAWFVLVLSLLLFAGLPFHHVNAASILGCVWLVWSVFWLLNGWNFAYRMIPAFLILSLGTPSSTYQLSQLTMCSVPLTIGMKFILAGGMSGWIYCNQKFDLSLPKESTCFIFASLLTLSFWQASSHLVIHESFIPEYRLQAGEFMGRTLTPDANTMRFFATSTVKQYRYHLDGTDVSVLAVKCGRDIHEIHPASHCLRTSQWDVISERIYQYHDNFSVTEIEAKRGTSHILLWNWYSGRDFSTPGFLGFRRYFRQGTECYTYQISVPIRENPEQARKILRDFISALQ